MAKKNTIKELIKENVDALVLGMAIGACLQLYTARRERIAYHKGFTSRMHFTIKEKK